MRKRPSKNLKPVAMKGWRVTDMERVDQPQFSPDTVIMGPCFVVDKAGVVWLADPAAGMIERVKAKPAAKS